MHSFSDEAAMAPIILHPQVIVDARTVLQITQVVRPYLTSA
jgi:hypothetical protein